MHTQPTKVSLLILMSTWGTGGPDGLEATVGRARLKSLPEPLVTQALSSLLGNLLIQKVKQEGTHGGLCSQEDGVTWFPYSSPV